MHTQNLNLLFHKLIPMTKSISNFVSRLAVVLLVVMTTVSCENTDSPELANDGNTPSGPHIKYKYNGNVYILPEPTTENTTNKKIDCFIGSGTTLNRVTLYMPLDVIPGTYFLTPNPSDDDTYGAYLILASNGIDVLADSGIITITNVTDDIVEGTFQFTAMNGSQTVNITHGTFSADY